jgi:hypothetical protein
MLREGAGAWLPETGRSRLPRRAIVHRNSPFDPPPAPEEGPFRGIYRAGAFASTRAARAFTPSQR